MTAELDLGLTPRGFTRLTDACFRVDFAWVIRQGVAPASAWLSIAPGELEGADFWDVLPASIRDQVEESLSDVMQQNESRTLDFALPAGRWVEIRAYPDRDGAVLFVTDITRRRTAEVAAELAFAAEREARRLAEEASEVKSQFLAVMSHELRTPLNVIRGYADLLLEGVRGDLGDHQRAAIEGIRRAQGELLALVSRILDFDRLQRGMSDVTVGRVDVEEVLRQLRQVLEARGVPAPRVEIASLPPGLAVAGNEGAILEILLALVDNALRFGGEDTPVRLGVTAGERVEFHVTDSGPGVPPERAEAIFQPFTQLDQSYSRNVEGIGLGLASARARARAMQGELRVTRADSGGADFVLTLPHAPAPGEQ